jgi:ribosomal protein S18 acetylase RimI-like enzyme
MMDGSTPWLELGYGRERCAAMLQSCLDELQVAVGPEGAPSGFVCLQARAFLGQPYVKLLAVAASARGRGVGRALMEWAVLQALEHWKAHNLFLLVSDFNLPARAFYSRLGFHEVGCLPDFLAAGRDEILLRKTRGPLLEASADG